MSYKVAVFASGNGTNAERLFEYFENHDSIKVVLLLSNNPKAKALERAERWKVPTMTFNKDELLNTSKVIRALKSYDIDWIALAGFLWMVPPSIVLHYTNRVVNLHPSLLPKYGGKGMYGKYVHEAVLKSGDNESGITIHLAKEEYDQGRIIFQATCKIEPDETVDSLTSKIHQLEYESFPTVLEDQILRKDVAR